MTNPGVTVFIWNIVFIRQKTGKICGIKVHHLGMVKGLDGFHKGVVHFGGAIHGNPGKAGASLPIQQVVIGFGVVVLAVRPLVDSGGLILAVESTGAAIQPEGNINACDFFHLLLGCKKSGKQGLALAELLKSLLCILLCGLKRDDTLRFQAAGEPRRHDGRVSAVRAEGGCSLWICYDFTAAAGAYKGVQGRFLFFAPLCIRNMLPLFFRAAFTHILFIEGTHGINVKGVVTVFALQQL